MQALRSLVGTFLDWLSCNGNDVVTKASATKYSASDSLPTYCRPAGDSTVVAEAKRWNLKSCFGENSLKILA
jgi:hypothetical protein